MPFTSEVRVREMIRLIVAEADPEKRKALAEELERLLKLESKAVDANEKNRVISLYSTRSRF